MDKTHISYCGMFVTTSNVSDTLATVNVKTNIVNQSASSMSITLKTIIIDESRNVVATKTPGSIVVNADSKGLSSASVAIKCSGANYK